MSSGEMAASRTVGGQRGEGGSCLFDIHQGEGLSGRRRLVNIK